MLILITMLIGCGSQFICDFHPEKFKLTESFSIDGKNTKVNAIQLAKRIEEFGLDNGYCIANASMDQSSTEGYFVNIRIVKDGYSFYVRGGDGYIFWLQQKNVNSNIANAKKEFCNFIKPLINEDKVEYYEDTGNLCDFN